MAYHNSATEKQAMLIQVEYLLQARVLIQSQKEYTF